ncbi:MAG TPA: uroporphyrinogen-III synthase [Terriglobales bacterium]|nr:uroporphyrinogen-III synthase [Terriglobales bacterium]
MNKSGGQLPLSGTRILVGRARHQAGALSENLQRLGAEVLEIPFIEIRKPSTYQPLDDALRKIRSYQWLILTSVNGVDALWERLGEVGMSSKELQHLTVAAIGPATKKAIEEHGLPVHVVPDKYVAESVVQSLRNRVAGQRVLLARAKVARDVIPSELRKLGAEVDVVEVYETIVPEGSKDEIRTAFLDARSKPGIVVFTSSSTVRNFMSLVQERKLLEGVRLASIGPVTSSTLRELGLRVDIEAEQYTIPGLVQAILRDCAQASSSK